MTYDYLGLYNNIPVAACTDLLGPQVIFGGSDYPIHKLTQRLISHQEAVALAEKIVKNGPEVYTHWMILKG